MLAQIAMVLFLSMQITLSEDSPPPLQRDYCIIGAGPSGLQLGYFLQKAGRDYVIFERANTSGSFFVEYPRHRTLISINKRNTGKTNKEFNMRHDWNSLLSDDESLQIRHYSREFFPHADVMLKYLNDYTEKLNIKVQYNTNIVNIKKPPNKSAEHKSGFHLTDQVDNRYECKTLIVSTGLSTPNEPPFNGSEFTVGYKDMSLNKEDYEGKTVLILGKGNSAFETADHIMGNTNLIHMVARTRVRLSWETHYVGDLRAINNGLLDTYQLKSLDGILEAPLEEVKLVKKDGKIYVDLIDADLLETNSTYLETEAIDNFAAREPYDVIIRCLGFMFDFSIFDESVPVIPGTVRRQKKYPLINDNYEAVNIPGLFFAGTNTHSLDFRKSAGGFIHGFRYTARALSKILEFRNHQVPWPSVAQPTTELLNHIIKRVNEASGIYQMFGVLSDVVLLSKNGRMYTYLEEFPVKLLHDLPAVTGHEVDKVMVITLEYGKNFSGPGSDPFRTNRAIGDPIAAYLSNFLHPVVYYYDKLPSKEDFMTLSAKFDILPRPLKIHHIVEDFLTLFTAPNSHILPLRRFIESCLDTDLRNFYDIQCFSVAMTSQDLPWMCQQHDYQLQMGLSGERTGTMNNDQRGELTFGT